MNKLKEQLKMEWAKLDHVITVTAIRQQRCHLTVCVEASSGHLSTISDL